jgi:Cellulase (glycosyl hydrolase family 5)
MNNIEFQSKLKCGVTTDWCKTNPGRTAIKKARSSGVNVPKLFKDRGFDHARIRVADDVNKGVSLLFEIQAVVAECLAADLIPIVSYQAAGFKTDPTNVLEMQRVIDWWDTVDRAFAPGTALAFNLIIETTDALKKYNDRLNQIYQKLADLIIPRGDDRLLIVSPNKISDPFELPYLVIPTPRDQFFVESHYYAAGPSRTLGSSKLWTTGTDAEKKLITDRIDFAKKWSIDNNMPVWCGAISMGNYNEDDSPISPTFYDGAPQAISYSLEEMTTFARFMADAHRSAGIPFAVNSDSKYYNRETNQWYESVKPLLDAILGT